MGASNFARGNTSKVFAVLMDTEEKYSKCNECDEKNFEWEENYVEIGEACSCGSTDIEHSSEYRSVEDFEVSDFNCYLKEVAQNHSLRVDYKYQEESGSDNDRNYPATNIFSLSSYRNFGDIEIHIKVIAKIVGGYYEGASLDFIVEYNGEEYAENKPDFDWYFEYQSNMSKGLQVIQSRNAVKWAEKETQKIIEVIENIFTEVSQPLNVVATFSNGETIYEKSN